MRPLLAVAACDCGWCVAGRVVARQRSHQPRHSLPRYDAESCLTTFRARQPWEGRYASGKLHNDRRVDDGGP